MASNALNQVAKSRGSPPSFVAVSFVSTLAVAIVDLAFFSPRAPREPTEEQMKLREESKHLSLQIKELKEKYTKKDKQNGLTPAQQVRIDTCSQ